MQNMVQEVTRASLATPSEAADLGSNGAARIVVGNVRAA